MKYFTMEWQLAIQDFDLPVKEMDRPGKEYSRYYVSIKKQLPKQFVDFDESYSLHDATFLKLNLDTDKKQLKIKFMLAIVHKHFIEGRNGTLVYSGVTNFSISKRAEISLADPADSYGFLLSDEIEIIGPNLFEHRVLFSSRVEFGIIFTDFRFSIDV